MQVKQKILSLQFKPIYVQSDFKSLGLCVAVSFQTKDLVQGGLGLEKSQIKGKVDRKPFKSYNSINAHICRPQLIRISAKILSNTKLPEDTRADFVSLWWCHRNGRHLQIKFSYLLVISPSPIRPFNSLAYSYLQDGFFYNIRPVCADLIKQTNYNKIQ